MIRETPAQSRSGLFMLFLLPLLLIVDAWWMVAAARTAQALGIVGGSIGILVLSILRGGV